MSSYGLPPGFRDLVDVCPSEFLPTLPREDHKNKRPGPEYPKVLLKKVKAVRKTPSVPGEVLVLVYECRRPHGDQDFTIVGIYSAVGIANKVALNVFKRDNPEFLLYDGDDDEKWVEGGDGPDENCVA